MAPNHKNNSCLKNSNCKHVSIFFNLSKIFERFLHRMLFKYFETIGSSNQWSFWKGDKAQIVILAMLEKCKSVLAESGKFGTLSNWLKRYCNWFYCAWFKNSQTSRICLIWRPIVEWILHLVYPNLSSWIIVFFIYLFAMFPFILKLLKLQDMEMTIPED